MSTQQRRLLLVAILASGVAFLDGSIINVALPAMQHDLGGGLVMQQWVVDAYLLTLGSLILIAGSISDLFGRYRVLVWGLIGFLATSLLCSFALNATWLTIGRGLQGVAGALLVPSSLAILRSAFTGAQWNRAIGLWTAWTSAALIIGPLLGGVLIDVGSWRLIFVINVLPILAVLLLLRKDYAVDAHKVKKIPVDFIGAILCAIGLGGSIFALIEQPSLGWSNVAVVGALIGGVVGLIAFFVHEANTEYPMLPYQLFAHRNFSVGNLATLLIYGSLAATSVVVPIYLQQVAGYSATAAGLALTPISIFLALLSSYFGRLSGRFGPRLFMSLGPLLIMAGTLLYLWMGARADYLTEVMPAVLVYGLGLSITVAPLTATVINDIAEQESGIGSAINNAVARIAGLIAIAIIGTFLSVQFSASLHQHLTRGHIYVSESTMRAMVQHPLVAQPPVTVSISQFSDLHSALLGSSTVAFHYTIIVLAILYGIGGIISALGIRNRVVDEPIKHPIKDLETV